LALQVALLQQPFCNWHCCIFGEPSFPTTPALVSGGQLLVP